MLFVAGVLRGLREVRSRDENIARGLYIAAHRQRASTSLSVIPWASGHFGARGRSRRGDVERSPSELRESCEPGRVGSVVAIARAGRGVGELRI